MPIRSLPAWPTLALLVALAVAGPASAASVTVVGDWQLTLDASDLTAGAGSDLVSSHESSASQTSVDIAATGGGGWRIDVSKNEISWPAGVGLAVRRTGDGTGSGSISGGSSYQALGSTAVELFSGTGDRSGVTIQSRVDGVSVSVAPATYQAEVIFTVVDQ